MDLSKAKALGFEIPTWQEALASFLELDFFGVTQEKGAGYYEKQYYFGMCGDRGKTLFD
jgi:hypothetical protein